MPWPKQSRIARARDRLVELLGDDAALVTGPPVVGALADVEGASEPRGQHKARGLSQSVLRVRFIAPTVSAGSTSRPTLLRVNVSCTSPCVGLWGHPFWAAVRPLFAPAAQQRH